MTPTTEPTQKLVLWVQIFTSIIGALATLAAVIVALFIEPIKAAWFGPKLVLKLVEQDGHLLRYTADKPQIFYHLKVENQKRFCRPVPTAQNCRVVVRDIQMKHGSGSFITINLPAPMQLRWPGWMVKHEK
jgi:Na+/H+ antiporter NhaA